MFPALLGPGDVDFFIFIFIFNLSSLDYMTSF